MTTLVLERPAAGSRLRDYVAIARPRMSLLLLATVAIGACLAAGSAPPLTLLLHAVIGAGLVGTACSAFNQVLERDTDALMRRTEARPLPARRLSPFEVLAFGTVTGSLGLAELAWGANPLAAGIALLTLATYVLFYTPLKRRTTFNTAVGAIPGALPPLIGWAAVRGSLDPAAWTLFAIVFLWQFPHFLAIAWLNREDYGRAGLKMLPVVDARLASWQAVNYALALIPVSLLPCLVGSAGRLYFASALWLGLAFLGTAVHFLLHESRAAARGLLVASLVYLPALLGLTWLDRLPAN